MPNLALNALDRAVEFVRDFAADDPFIEEEVDSISADDKCRYCGRTRRERHNKNCLWSVADKIVFALKIEASR